MRNPLKPHFFYLSFLFLFTHNLSAGTSHETSQEASSRKQVSELTAIEKAYEAHWSEYLAITAQEFMEASKEARSPVPVSRDISKVTNATLWKVVRFMTEGLSDEKAKGLLSVLTSKEFNPSAWYHDQALIDRLVTYLKLRTQKDELDIDNLRAMTTQEDELGSHTAAQALLMNRILEDKQDKQLTEEIAKVFQTRPALAYKYAKELVDKDPTKSAKRLASLHYSLKPEDRTRLKALIGDCSPVPQSELLKRLCWVEGEDKEHEAYRSAYKQAQATTQSENQGFNQGVNCANDSGKTFEQRQECREKLYETYDMDAVTDFIQNKWKNDQKDKALKIARAFATETPDGKLLFNLARQDTDPKTGVSMLIGHIGDKDLTVTAEVFSHLDEEGNLKNEKLMGANLLGDAGTTLGDHPLFKEVSGLQLTSIASTPSEKKPLAVEDLKNYEKIFLPGAEQGKKIKDIINGPFAHTEDWKDVKAHQVYNPFYEASPEESPRPHDKEDDIEVEEAPPTAQPSSNESTSSSSNEEKETPPGVHQGRGPSLEEIMALSPLQGLHALEKDIPQMVHFDFKEFGRELGFFRDEKVRAEVLEDFKKMLASKGYKVFSNLLPSSETFFGQTESEGKFSKEALERSVYLDLGGVTMEEFKEKTQAWFTESNPHFDKLISPVNRRDFVVYIPQKPKAYETVYEPRMSQKEYAKLLDREIYELGIMENNYHDGRVEPAIKALGLKSLSHKYSYNGGFFKTYAPSFHATGVQDKASLQKYSQEIKKKYPFMSTFQPATYANTVLSDRYRREINASINTPK